MPVPQAVMPTPKFSKPPKPASTGLYRYLSMKIYADGPWQNIPDGMITRLVWSIQGTGGGGSVCYLVSQDIPYDIGWHTYFIDLYDAFNGSIRKSRELSGQRNLMAKFRHGHRFPLDPNENQLGRTLNQKIEWVRLTAMDRVSRGSKFPVSLLLNKAPGAISSYRFYYTNSPGAPTQHPANGSINSPLPNPGPSPRGPHTLFLPSVLSNVYSSVAQEFSIQLGYQRGQSGSILPVC